MASLSLGAGTAVHIAEALWWPMVLAEYVDRWTAVNLRSPSVLLDFNFLCGITGKCAVMKTPPTSQKTASIQKPVTNPAIYVLYHVESRH